MVKNIRIYPRLMRHNDEITRKKCDVYLFVKLAVQTLF